MATLAEIRAKLLAAEKTKGGNATGGNRDNSVFPHWNIPDNSTVTVRFLEDGDATNDYFWRERLMIKIPFTGVKGHDESKQVIVQVPCIEMWGKECPVHREIRPWFKDPTMEDMARKYWKKRSYLFQGLIVDSPLVEDDAPANPIRRFTISPSIYKTISGALMDPDFGDYLPTDIENGTDFRITKTQKGQYADYSTSGWARKERGLDQAERDIIAEHGLHNLNDYMPKEPNAEELNAIFEMFEASVEGELYDPERFADYYRPWGLDKPNTGSTQTAEPAPSTPAAETKASTPVEDAPIASAPAPVEKPAASEGTKDAKDILAAIRARKETN